MKAGALRVSIDRIKPNTWNPNSMSSTMYAKLKNGIRKVVESQGSIPPIVVRPNTERNCYEVIDGEHRLRVLKELGVDKVQVYSIDVDDGHARILTSTLNYVRGKADREKYAKGLVELVGLGVPLEDLAALLPETEGELSSLLQEADITVEAFLALQDTDGENLDDITGADDTSWVEVKFRVTTKQAEIIEREVARIGAAISGKNARGRALEYIAVMSSQTSVTELGV